MTLGPACIGLAPVTIPARAEAGILVLGHLRWGLSVARGQLVVFFSAMPTLAGAVSAKPYCWYSR